MLVLGDGEQRGSLEALSRELHVDDRVIFFGHVAQNKVQSILAQTDVFLSLYDLSNIGNPLFEAMNAGVPVLTVDVGATGTVIRDGENGLLLSTWDLPEAVKRLGTLLDDGRLRKTIAANAAAYIEKNLLSWQARIAAELSVVGELLDRQ